MKHWYREANWVGVGMMVTFLVAIASNSLLPFVGWLIGAVAALIETELSQRVRVCRERDDKS